MDKININNLEVENVFSKCGLASDADNPGNCYGDGDGYNCDACDNCDAPASDE